MKLNIDKKELELAAEAMVDINKIIEHSKAMVSSEFLFAKEDFVTKLDQITTLLDVLITAGTMQIETQLMIDEMENAP